MRENVALPLCETQITEKSRNKAPLNFRMA
jgi:hypothetical protein